MDDGSPHTMGKRIPDGIADRALHDRHQTPPQRHDGTLLQRHADATPAHASSSF